MPLEAFNRIFKKSMRANGITGFRMAGREREGDDVFDEWCVKMIVVVSDGEDLGEILEDSQFES